MLFGYSALPEYCAAAKEIGYNYVELPGKVIAAMSDKEFSAFADKLPLPALGMNAFCPPTVVIAGPGYDIQFARQYVKGLAQRAAVLGIKMVGIGSPMSRILPDGFDTALAHTQIKEFLLETAYIFDQYGIYVCLEALATCYCNTVNTLKEATDIVRDLNCPNIQVVLDFYNMEHMGEEDISDAPFIHVHTSDDDGSPSLRSYLKPEKREIHQKRLRQLANAGYDGGVTLELDVPFDPRRAAYSLDILRQAIREE